MLFLQLYALLLSIVLPIFASVLVMAGRSSRAEEIRQTLYIPQNNRISA